MNHDLQRLLWDEIYPIFNVACLTSFQNGSVGNKNLKIWMEEILKVSCCFCLMWRRLHLPQTPVFCLSSVHSCFQFVILSSLGFLYVFSLTIVFKSKCGCKKYFSLAHPWPSTCLFDLSFVADLKLVFIIFPQTSKVWLVPEGFPRLV